METSLKVAKFMESPHMLPLLRHTHHHFLFYPKQKGVGFKTTQEKKKVHAGERVHAHARRSVQITSSQ